MSTTTRSNRKHFSIRAGLVLLAGAAMTTGTCGFAGLGSESCPTGSSPAIDVWYGDQQRVGHLGQAQSWFNVLGSVDEPERIESLEARLNDGARRSISIGPDGRRLGAPGDFNVDLAISDLDEGDNEVVIEAVDCAGERGETTLTVEYEPAPSPATVDVDWESATSIDDVAQVVDGRWELDGDAVRAIEPDYDRLIAIGDVSFTDYEVTVPITVHGLDERGFERVTSGSGAAVGVLLRWSGHTDAPIDGRQPVTGWYPYGSLGWYWWNSADEARLRLDGMNSSPSTQGASIIIAESPDAQTPPFDEEFVLKMRVETLGDGTTEYSVKTWLSSETEPPDWELTGLGPDDGPTRGSVMLVAHHVDASFGSVSIVPLTPGGG